MKRAAIASAAMLIGVTFLMSGCGSLTSGTSTPTDSASRQAPEEPGQNQGKISLQRNLYFVFDGSGSMNDPPKNTSSDGRAFISKIAGARWAVREFLKKVPDNVNLGLYVFDGNGQREAMPLGSDNRARFLEAIDSVQAGGSTPLGAAIRGGADALARQYKRQLGYGEYRLIVITDGEATDSLADGVNAAAQEKIPIYTIGFDMGNEHSLRQHSVSYRSADSASEVEKGLEEAGAELDVFDSTAFPNKATETEK